MSKCFWMSRNMYWVTGMLASIRSVSLLKYGCPYVYSVKCMVAEDVCKMLHNMNLLGQQSRQHNWYTEHCTVSDFYQFLHAKLFKINKKLKVNFQSVFYGWYIVVRSDGKQNNWIVCCLHCHNFMVFGFE